MASSALTAVLLLTTLITVSGTADLQSDRAALLAFRSGFGPLRIHWNTSATPCSWTGVTCISGRVTKLRLPAIGLIGQLHPSTIGNLTALRTLSLRLNALSGPFPLDFAGASQLRNIYLQGNHFSGPLPPTLSYLQSLVKLNLASNGFSGGIPPAFNNLTRLRVLFLERNNLSGHIPDLDLPNLAQFNLSYNQLTGSIPERLHKWPSSAFLSMALCGGPFPACPGEISPAPEPMPPKEPGRRHKLSHGALAGIIVGTAVAVLIGAVLLFLYMRKRGTEEPPRAPVVPPEGPNRRQHVITIEQPRTGVGLALLQQAMGAFQGMRPQRDPVVPPEEQTRSTVGQSQRREATVEFLRGEAVEFSMEDVLHATDQAVLGKGLCGTTFKAVLGNGTAVAMKRLENVILHEEELEERLQVLGSIIHRNVQPIKAYCFNKEEKLLFYDYIPIGSLHNLLHGSRESGERNPLDWKRRYDIAAAVAEGIEHIHARETIHGNIKSSNILIGESNDVRVSENGLLQLIATDMITATRFAGYGAPELIDRRKASKETDVYSFGVLLLELISGRAPSSIIDNEGLGLPNWVESIAREDWSFAVFDPELPRNPDADEKMLKLLEIALECASPNPEERKSMHEVLILIQEYRDE